MPAVLLALLAAATLAACKINLQEAEQRVLQCKPSEAPVCVMAESENRSDFAWLQQNMFSTNCAGDDCHGSPANNRPPDGELVLATGFAYKTLLGKEATDTGDAPLVDSSYSPAHKLIVPGHPEDSYLLFLLKHYYPEDGTPWFAEPPADIGYMPQSNNTLCCQKLDAVERWIAAGALP